MARGIPSEDGKRDNYATQRERAKQRFLTFSYEKIAERWDLKLDAGYLYVDFLGSRYRIARNTAEAERILSKTKCALSGKSDRGMGQSGSIQTTPAGFEETLAIFDLLCHSEGELPHASGVFAPVNSLRGRPQTIGVTTDFGNRRAQMFDSDLEGFCRACESMGGMPVGIGDLGYEFPVFKDLRIRLKFYRADEEFAAQTVYLLDENALQYLFYETAFYVMGCLGEQIEETMAAEATTTVGERIGGTII